MFNFSNRILIAILFLCITLTFAQNQKRADSLIVELEEKRYDGYLEELDLLEKICRSSLNPEQRLKYSELLIVRSSQDSVLKYMYGGYLEKGNALKDLGNYSDALEAYFTSLKLCEKAESKVDEGRITIAIADTYSESGNDTNALRYYKDGIEILRTEKDSMGLANALLNAGDTAFNMSDYDLAIAYFEESSQLFEDLDILIGKAYNLGNMGMVYAETEQSELAANNINQAMKMLEELEDYYAISVYLTYMSDIYLEKNDWRTAENYAQQSLNLAEKYHLKQQIRDANLHLSKLYENRSNYQKSFDYYKTYIVYRDSILNLESVEEMANMRTEYEVSQKQAEVDILQKDTEILELRDERNQQVILGTVIALGLLVLMAIGLFHRNKYIRKTNAIIEAEKKKSDDLLLNILPEETAKELKESGKVAAKRFESVSVLFTDFKGFTHFAENLDPEILVQSMDYYFSQFDTIIEKYGLEKIKTVGDAYMCAGGLPFPTKDHAEKIVSAALEIVDEVKRIKADPAHEYNVFDIRVGINTGPVVAGVVGTKKFVYDIWGDTVNIAARMESNSEPGYVNISENTYELVKDKFDCEFRGLINAKNRGDLKMYFVNGPKTVLQNELQLEQGSK